MAHCSDPPIIAYAAHTAGVARIISTPAVLREEEAGTYSSGTVSVMLRAAGNAMTAEATTLEFTKEVALQGRGAETCRGAVTCSA